MCWKCNHYLNRELASSIPNEWLEFGGLENDGLDNDGLENDWL